MFDIMDHIAGEIRKVGVRCTINTTDILDKNRYNSFIRTLPNEENQYDMCNGVFKKQFEVIVVSDYGIDEEFASFNIREIIKVLKGINYVTLTNNRIICIVDIESNYKGLNEQDLKVYDIVFGVNYVEKNV